MIKELLLSVDISDRQSVLTTINYLYSIMPKPEEDEFLKDDYALMTLDYDASDPYVQRQHLSVPGDS